MGGHTLAIPAAIPRAAYQHFGALPPKAGATEYLPRHPTVADGNWNALASDAERAAYTVRCSYRPGSATSVALSFVGDADAAAIRAVVLTRRRDGEVLGGFVPGSRPGGWHGTPIAISRKRDRTAAFAHETRRVGLCRSSSQRIRGLLEESLKARHVTAQPKCGSKFFFIKKM